MSYFVGIDLGTTNSSICSYDGKNTRIWKSPEQNDVTPSVIYYDRRGNKYVGKRAYDSAPNNPDNSAQLFKRLMGSSTPIKIKALNKILSPEECSAEVLKVLFGYLPEEIRNDPETGTVITVPAAFNQMQKDATMQAAKMAGIGRVALMQEPVAAVMSVMRTKSVDGTFLIFDLGGGTLDVAVAESIAGRVNLLAHGGIQMCGGRDFDRQLIDNVVKPWLYDNFDLPDDFAVDPRYRALMRLAAWATERAKIELSAKDVAVISLSETELRARDDSGEELYLDIPLTRDTLDELIKSRVDDAIQSARDALEKAGLSPFDLEKIVFVGGPTNYKPLRDMVTQGLGVEGSTDVNPMTAVAEGAALFAESIDWKKTDNSRKSTKGQISTGGDISLRVNFTARTPAARAKVAIQVLGSLASGVEFQIDNLDSGWTSGRIPLKVDNSINLLLENAGPNKFKISVFDANGSPVNLPENEFTITRTAATVDAIPASYSIGIEVLEKLGGPAILDYLVKAGDPLPKKGKKIFKAGETLRSGSPDSLNFKLWEGDIEDPITDNRPIGVLKVSGNDFDEGTIFAGCDLECEYEIEDSGNIKLEVSIPSIGGIFNPGKNFYSRQEGSIDFSDAFELVTEEAEETMNRLDEIADVVDDPKLDDIREKLERVQDLDPEESDTETVQEAMESVYSARRQLAQVKKQNLKKIRQNDLDHLVDFFNESVRQYAKAKEIERFEALVKVAQRAIDRNEKEFESFLDDLRGLNFIVLWRNDWFVMNRFKYLISRPNSFTDSVKFSQLAAQGQSAIKSGNINVLRKICYELNQIRRHSATEDDLMQTVNIVRG